MAGKIGRIMEIIEIKDSGNNQVKKQPKIAVGIDFGTTNSLVAYADSDKPEILTQKPTIFSVDCMSQGEKIRSIKRLIGKSFEDIQNSPEITNYVKSLISEDKGEVKINIGTKEYSIREAISVIISDLKKEAEEVLNKNIEAAVITVPAHFDDVMRSCIKEAASFAGLEVMRLISEPTAAAYAYGLENGSEGKYAIYDLGGGTFDISLLRMKMGVFQVIATDGNNMIGGDDIDHAISLEFLSQNAKISKDEAKILAKLAKEYLAENNEWKNLEYQISLSKKDFEKIAYNLIEPTIEMTKNIIGNHEIEGIVLVGGSTKMPLVKSLLSELGYRIFDDIDPDLAVADGAAMQARNLTGVMSDLLIDALPLSLGMEIMGGIMEKIILRNSPLPISISQEFTTYVDNQTEIQINIFQGEREMVKDCRPLGRFTISDIPPMKAGMPRMEVTFNLDADGLLTVSAIEKVTGLKQNIEVRPTYGITNEAADKMLEDSYRYAKEDHEARLLAEAVINANREIDSLQKAFIETPDILSEKEIGKIKEQITKLQQAVISKIRPDITDNTNMLKEISEEFRAARMNYILKESLKNKKV